MIKSVVREHHWEPNIIGSLFIDGDSYDSLEYWYDDIQQMHEDLKPKKK